MDEQTMQYQVSVSLSRRQWQDVAQVLDAVREEQDCKEEDCEMCRVILPMFLRAAQPPERQGELQ